VVQERDGMGNRLVPDYLVQEGALSRGCFCRFEKVVESVRADQSLMPNSSASAARSVGTGIKEIDFIAVAANRSSITLIGARTEATNGRELKVKAGRSGGRQHRFFPPRLSAESAAWRRSYSGWGGLGIHIVHNGAGAIRASMENDGAVPGLSEWMAAMWALRAFHSAVFL
jgi:hypothetical protein